MGEEIELALDAVPPPKCKHCGRDKGKHRANTLSCPVGRGSFPSFSTETVYEPRKARPKKAQPPTAAPAPGDVVQARFKALPAHLKDDIVEAALWARTVLDSCDAPGHRFQLHPAGDARVTCSINHPEWSRDHVGAAMATGSEALLMAVCDYVYGSA